jgi:putative glutamine amidotransferase
MNVAEFERVLLSEHGPLTRRLERMLRSPELAEDLRQETLARAWESAPRDVSPERLRAWVHRVASNLAIDQMRRAARQPLQELDDSQVPAPSADRDEVLAAREALERISPHQRMLLLMRLEAGLGYDEIAALLDISAEAARQRLTRARRAFSQAFRDTPLDRPPRIYVLFGEDDPDRYLSWLREAGADARPLEREHPERDLALADGLVVAGSRTDVHPAIYGQRARAELVDPDAEQDRGDMAVLRTALEQDIPLIGICRGHQLLNVLLGGDLHQDLAVDRVAPSHPRTHSIRNSQGTLARRVLGAQVKVSSRHHQAVSRVGGGLRAASTSDDGLVEAVELPRRRFAIGVQFHPEDQMADGDRRLAEALVDASAMRAA